ncbi:hypothetical protein K469DRAFT_748526 [Zopfia rhizophila CBS 207.26]|uniref:Uncharacterized protein n=1 Tax=Zopfia rhizophila CBS 207.26 TaxID=1314779 RepID=A0A6A6EE84_9PEZI|nr:hypothetical protein K469DRAFT_748526 [Zopfia rhizophila CBS 207.26]
MPPALSDYDSDDVWWTEDLDEVEDVKRLTPDAYKEPGSDPREENTITVKAPLKVQVKDESKRNTQATLKRKRKPRILIGLDSENIIEISDDEQELEFKDTPPTSSIPSSSYKTRAQVHGSRRDELCYDQKYHPMDEYTHPKRAARVKSKYGEDLLASEGTIASSFDDDRHTESETDLDENPKLKGKGRKLPLPPSQPTRRSSRQVNWEIMYNVNVHTQDAELKEMERSDEMEESSRKRRKTRSQDSDQEEEKEHKDSGNVFDLTIINSEDSDSECRPSPIRRSSPLTSIKQDQCSPAGMQRYKEGISVYFTESSKRDSWVIDNDFDIYEEPMEVQLAAESSAPPPRDYDDDDKENEEEESSDESTADALRGITVIAVSALLRYRTMSIRHATGAANEHNFEFDSVLGAPTPGNFEVDRAQDAAIEDSERDATIEI